MTGKEILEMIRKKDKEYIASTKSEKEQPSVALSTHECFKLADCIGRSSMYYHSVRCLAEGELTSFNFESVKITKEAGK